MVTLADAAMLVPPRSNEKQPSDVHQYMTPTDLFDALANRDSTVKIVQRLGEFVRWATDTKRQKNKDEQTFATHGLRKLLESEAEEGAEEGGGLASSLIGRLARWVGGKVVKFAFNMIRRAVVRLASWFIREIIGGTIRLAMEFIIRPVLMDVLGFIGLNPELWPFVAVAGGVAALGYVIYDQFFADKNPTPLPESASKESVEATRKEAMSQPKTTVAERGVSIVEQPATPAKPAGAPVAARAPVTTRAAQGDLGSLISRGEGDYNSVNRGAAHSYKAGVEDLEHMTVGEVMAHQRAQDFNAAGRYQIIKPTLASAFKAMGLSGNEKFDKQLQDHIFNEYLVGNKRHQMADYISGKSDNLTAAILAASQEWASVAAPNGVPLANGRIGDGRTSYYAGSANNKASISADEMAAALNAERAKYLGKTSATADVAAVKQGITTSAPSTPNAAQMAAHQGSSGAVPGGNTNGRQIIRGPKNTLIALNQ